MNQKFESSYSNVYYLVPNIRLFECWNIFLSYCGESTLWNFQEWVKNDIKVTANWNANFHSVLGLMFKCSTSTEVRWQYCQNPNTTTTQLNIICLARHENDFAYHPTHPTTQTQCQQYLSCYWPDLDESLNVDSWEHLEQISAGTVTFVQTTYVLVTFVHIRNISTVTDPILMKL